MRVRLIFVVTALSAILAATQPGNERGDIAAVSWMTGSWEMKRANTVVEEHWTRAAGGTMIGMSRTIRAGKTVSFEYMRIEEDKDGLYLLAQPKGEPAVAFRATDVTASRVAFSNPEHDFPKRIIYESTSTGGLNARVEGDAESLNRPEEYTYRPMR